MSIAQDKQKVFSEISALRVSAEGYPKMILSNSIDSLKEAKGNSLDYLTDLLKSLVGFDSLKDVVVETLTQNLDEIEDDVKVALKDVLKTLISCSVNPKLPQSFIDNGITISLKNIDFLEPLNPNAPPLLHAIAFPASSVIVIIVLLKVERICATPVGIFFLTLRFLFVGFAI